VPREELLDAAPGVGGRHRVVADRGAAALVGSVAIRDVRQDDSRRLLDVEIVKGARIRHERDVGAADPHALHHLDARPRYRPVVGIADQHQQGRPRGVSESTISATYPRARNHRPHSRVDGSTP